MRKKKFNIIAFIVAIILGAIYGYSIFKDVNLKPLDDRDIVFKNKKEFEVDKIIKLNGEVAALDNKDGKLFYISKESLLYVIDISNKKIIKTIQIPSKKVYSDIEFYKNYIIAFNEEGYIAIVDINTGDVIRTDRVIEPYMDTLKVFDDKIYYSAGNDISIYARDFNTLKMLWSYKEDFDHTSTKITIDEGDIYCDSINKILVLDGNKGDVLKSYRTQAVSPYFIENDEIYTRSLGNSGRIYKLDKANGQIIWESDEDMIDTYIDEQNVYAYKGGYYGIIAIDKENGKQIWATDVGVFNNESIRSTDKYVIARRENGNIVVLDKKTGEKLWKFDVEKMEMWNQHVIVDNETIIIPSENGKIYFLNLND